MDLRAELCALVQEYGVAPGALRLEITETVMMEDQANRFEILRSLREAGFIVEMDDFGSGYSSLNMLRTMPVDVLKIDMMFLNDLQRMSRSCIILRSLVGMASELGLVPLTEGVETEEQYRILSQMGCQLFQGYLFARPMPAGDFDAAYLK
jgi:EAL domain-containing protein (putative c-di-GMP-specific phosphodiesterase class I)